MRRLILLAALLLGLLPSENAHGTILWKGDFQTGNLSQWGAQQEAATNRLQIVTSPVAPDENYALQVTVESGDLANNGARAEVAYEGDSPVEGDNRYYHWQTYFPADFVAADYWQIFTQWHQYITGGSPPLAIMVWGNQIKLGNENDVYFWTGPLQLGEWHDFIVHVTWSTSATVGGVEVWYDGQHVLPFTSTATLFPGDTVYLKQGLYRKSAISYTQTLYHWGMTIATELADVLAGQPDAGSGTAAPDAGSGRVDAGVPAADAGAAPVDAGGSPPDAGQSELVDAGSSPDGGSVVVPPVDAGANDSDAGSGVSREDAGNRGTAAPADAGASTMDPGSGGEAPPKKSSSCDSAGETWALGLLAVAVQLSWRRRPGRVR